MSIIATEIESEHGDSGGNRLIFYRCQDSQGVWHMYGPVISSDPAFDASDHKSVVAVKMAERLAEYEVVEIMR